LRSEPKRVMRASHRTKNHIHIFVSDCVLRKVNAYALLV